MRALWWIALIVLGLLTLVVSIAGGGLAAMMQAADLPAQSALYWLLMIATIVATARSLLDRPRRGWVLPVCWVLFLAAQVATIFVSDAYATMTCEERDGVPVVNTECDGDGLIVGLGLLAAALPPLALSILLAFRPRRREASTTSCSPSARA